MHKDMSVNRDYRYGYVLYVYMVYSGKRGKILGKERAILGHSNIFKTNLPLLNLEDQL